MRSVFGKLLAVIFIPLSAFAGQPAYLEFPDPSLQAGRGIWLENCEGCHGYGFGGAPVPMQPDQWSHRLAKGKAVLYDHAIHGFYGPDDTIMPEKGGNPKLTDEQVKSAVDYMTSMAQHFIELQR